MPARENIVLKNRVYKFFQENKDKYKTATELAQEFKRCNDDEVSFNSLRIHYFSPLLKNQDQEILQTEKEDSSTSEQTKIEETNNGKIINYKGEKSITSLEEALEYFEVDLVTWEVEDWRAKSWDTSMNVKILDDSGKEVSKAIKRTNYAVSLWLKKKIEEINYEKIFAKVDELYNSFPIIKKDIGKGVGVLTIADIHMGLKVTKKGGVINTPEFNIDSVIRYLAEVADRMNQLNYNQVHLVILGDLVESVSGYNHIETLKEMESTITGGNIIILAFEILKEFVSRIKNLEKVYMISGNHDRLTPEKPMDKDGGAAQIVSYMLNNIVDVEWHPLLISKNIDSINYILTHGHLKISQQDLGKIFFEYGDQNLYNVMLSGHWHVRKSTKVFPEKNLILADTSKYRAIVCPPIVSGSRFTEENGWSCSPGFTITEANSSKSNINHYDLALN